MHHVFDVWAAVSALRKIADKALLAHILDLVKSISLHFSKK